jgi:hypothetical protein
MRLDQGLCCLPVPVPHRVVQGGKAVVGTLGVDLERRRTAGAARRQRPDDVGVPGEGGLMARRRAHQPVEPARIRTGLAQHADDAGVPVASGDPERRVVVVMIADGRQSLVEGRTGPDEPSHRSEVADLYRRRQRQRPDPVGVGRHPRVQETGDDLGAVAQRQVERRLLPVVAHRGTGSAGQQQPDRRLVLVLHRVHQRRVTEPGRLLVDEGAMVEEQADDAVVTGLRRLVQRRGAHARLDHQHIRAGLQQPLHQA